DVQAEADGERGQDARLPGAGGDVRLSGLYLRPVLLAEDGARAYIGTRPSGKRIARICATISEMTGRDQTLLDAETVVGRLNRTMVGWANYFCLGPVSKAYRAVDQHARNKRLRRRLCAKH